MITSLGGVRVLGMHHFHTSEPVLSITAAALKLRDDRYVEIPGQNEARGRVRVGSCDEAGIWMQVYEILSARFHAKEGRLPGIFNSLFYFVVDENGRSSCGTICVCDGDICFAG